MTFVEFLAAAMEIDAEATVEVRSVHFPSYGRREMRYALYTERRGWAIGETPGAALDRFRNALTLPTPETVGEIPVPRNVVQLRPVADSRDGE